MALYIKTGKRNLVVGYKVNDNEIEYEICDDTLGLIIDESDIHLPIEKEKIIKISIPEQVECIKSGTFIGFTNLADIEIRGKVYGVEWQGGTDNRWIVPISPTTMVEELKRGTGRIMIFRSSKQ